MINFFYIELQQSFFRKKRGNKEKNFFLEKKFDLDNAIRSEKKKIVLWRQVIWLNYWRKVIF